MISETSSFPFRHHALALALTLATGLSHAASINVNGSCSLVNAINNANANGDTDGSSGCAAGGSVNILVLAANTTYLLSTVNNNTDGPNGLPSIASTIIINGNLSTIQRSSEDDTPEFRLFHVASSGNLTLNNVKLTGGKVSGRVGGAIRNAGNLLLNDTTVSGNSAQNEGGAIRAFAGSSTILTNSIISSNSAGTSGGGIYNGGYLRVNKSNISSNIANIDGGGIFNKAELLMTSGVISINVAKHEGGGFKNSNGGNLTLSNTTITANTAGASGGGIFNAINLKGNTTYLKIDACTLAGNTATNNGGGVSNEGEFQLLNATISNNRAYFGGGIHNNGTLTLANSTLSNNSIYGTTGFGVGAGLANETGMAMGSSIIANSINGSDCSTSDIHQTTVNLVEDGGCDAELTGDPMLDARANNGGLTATHALRAGSPAINKVPIHCPPKDQRRVNRPQPIGGYCDIGAYERITTIPASVTTLVQFFDAQVASGGIISTSTGTSRLNGVRNQLLTAGDQRDHGPILDACTQLNLTIPYIDPDNSPDSTDYVTGSAAGTLTDEIIGLRSDWSCP